MKKTAILRSILHIFIAAGALFLAVCSAVDGSLWGCAFFLLLLAGALLPCFLPAFRRRLWRILAAILGILVVLLPLLLVCIGYPLLFHTRSEQNLSDEILLLQHPELHREEHSFRSTAGVPLHGCLYTCEGAEARPGVIVLAHGYGGGGHTPYLSCILRLTMDGWRVFAYDATAHGKSGGEGIGAMPRGTLDLASAIEYAEGLDAFHDQPVYLWGHSWGGYAVLNVLNLHPEVCGVVSVSGFDRSIDLIDANTGGAVSLFRPYLLASEFLQFGTIAFRSAVSGMRHSRAKILAVHSTDDPLVPPQYSLERYRQQGLAVRSLEYGNKGHAPFSGYDPAAPVSGINEELFRTVTEFLEDCRDPE